MTPRLGWPIAIATSALLATLTVVWGGESLVRAGVVGGFLLVCPGMAFVRLLDLDAVAEWTLAVALSIAVLVLASTALLYAGRWSVLAALLLVDGVTVVGMALQVVALIRRGRVIAPPRPVLAAIPADERGQGSRGGETG